MGRVQDLVEEGLEVFGSEEGKGVLEEVLEEVEVGMVQAIR